MRSQAEISSDQSILSGFNKDEWEIMKTQAAPLIFMYNASSWVGDSVERYGEHTPLRSYVGLVRNGGETTTLAVHRDDYLLSAHYLWEHRSKLEQAFKDFDEDNENFLQFVSELESGEQVIAKSFSEFLEKYHRMYSSGIMADGFLFCSDALVDEIRRKYPEDQHEVIDQLLHMPDLSFAQEEELSLCRIALADSAQKDELIKVHQKNFHWILNNYLKTEALPTTHFEERLAELDATEAQNAVNELEGYKKQHEEFVKHVESKGTIGIEDIQSLTLLGRISFYMDRRKASNLLGNHWIGRYIREQCDRLGISYDDVLLLLDHEFDVVVRDGASHMPDVSDRRKLFGIIHDRETERTCTGEGCVELENFLTVSVDDVQESVITGSSASKGIATGKVKVLEHASEKEFLEGEILVTSMTRPDFVPHMRKAAAIITDEGGITSHAAIVSRELGVPCIIGTKVATQVLNDGDEVEVDANNGVVKILKKS